MQKNILPTQKNILFSHKENHLTQKSILITMALAFITLFATSCERLSWEEEDPASATGKGTPTYNVTFRAVSYEQNTFEPNTHTRALQPISEVCTRITLAVFNENDEKEKVVSQTYDDKDFGTFSVALPEGTHYALVVAHNSSKNATVTSADKITFDSNRVTDTFYEYKKITVGSASTSIELTAKRAVAMFSLTINDEIPAECKKLKFYYTGGSSTFSAVKGFGSVNSRQTVTLDVTDGQNTYKVYTFPHEHSDQLRMTVTALDGSDNAIAIREFTDVPVTVNKVTEYSGDFFDGKTETRTNKVSIAADAQWADTIKHSF